LSMFLSGQTYPVWITNTQALSLD